MTKAMWNKLVKLTGYSMSTIKHWEMDARHGLTLERRRGSGRPTVMTERVIAALHKIAKDCEYMGTNEYYSVALTAAGHAVSTSAVQRYITRAEWKSGTASTVPVLTPENCQARLDFCYAMLRSSPGRDSRTVVLHGDEKMFTATGLARQRAPPDVTLHQPGKTNLYKNKIMVFSVVGKPMREYNFDGRLQLSIIGRLHVASVASKNHKKGDVYLKVDGDTTVDSNYFFNLITNETAPLIRAQFSAAELVVLQLDNAPGHVGKGNIDDIERAVNKYDESPTIKIVFQPPNSPDLNLNDLGLFHSMQKKYRVLRTRAKLKAAARQLASAPFVGGIGTRGQRAAEAAGARLSVLPMQRDSTPSPTPPAQLPLGCARFHNNESDADMPCIKCAKAGNLPADCGDGSWVRCDANGGWWHVACVRAWHEVVALPAKDSSAWVCALCRVGSSAQVGRGGDDDDEDDEDEAEEAWSSVFDVEVPMRYGLDDHEALWGTVRAAWADVGSQMIDKLCGTMQQIYGLVVEAKGGNRYDIRAKLRRALDEDDNSE
jgi:hypothetical protein